MDFRHRQSANALRKLSAEKIQLEQDLQDAVPAVDCRDGVRPEAEQQPLGLRRGRSGHQAVRKSTSTPAPASTSSGVYAQIRLETNRIHAQRRCKGGRIGSGPAAVSRSAEAGTVVHVAKRLGQLSEGNNGWLRLVDDDGKLRHTINTLGTVTGRCSSFGPNLQQVPAIRAAYGKSAGSCSTVPPGVFSRRG